MSKQLPPEIIRSIVLYLKNDKKFLYSSLFVSRDWFRGMIDLLWRQPFHLLYTCNKKTISTSSQSKNSCHCSEKKRQFQATNLLTTLFSIKYNEELVKEGIFKTKGEKYMFNYLEFLNVLDLRDLYSAIQDWNQWNKMNKSINSPLLNFLNNKFTSLTFNYNIFKYFFINSPKLKLLSFDSEFILHKINNNNSCLPLNKNIVEDDYWVNYNILNDLLLIINNSETIQFFSNLTELVFTTEERKTRIFSSLSQICHNIQKLIVKVKFNVITNNYGTALTRETNNTLEEAKQLISLIKSQHNLVYFELYDTHEAGTSEILKSLKETQHDSLKTLILSDVFINNNNTILLYLKYLRNLQELRLNKCIYQQNNSPCYWEDLWLPNLKYIQLDYIEEHKEVSEELSSILLGCSPLANKNLLINKS
ncbi:hypothetical protein RclHR1_00030064 [Rhizophagus clarus]|uniref:F-box domain-containing protein n=1 Tax=Rhizophagus clarus TaxID=94130 RepID=A0A2Z6R549_9GLOM|nr:hypothetical protein RclHR1_00030064 [Rhizophagus clarus]GES95578.1 hypothetical protein GLOIN_2v1474929 [Rhizophagus clarus]